MAERMLIEHTVSLATVFKVFLAILGVYFLSVLLVLVVVYFKGWSFWD